MALYFIDIDPLDRWRRYAWHALELVGLRLMVAALIWARALCAIGRILLEAIEWQAWRPRARIPSLPVLARALLQRLQFRDFRARLDARAAVNAGVGLRLAV